MILDLIKFQESERWYLFDELDDRLIYKTNHISDPFAAIEFVIRRDNNLKVFVLFKGEDNRAGMEMFIQKEISVDKYLNIADNMSDMFYDFLV